MAESIRKVVVTWSDWADLIPERSRLEGYEDLELGSVDISRYSAFPCHCE